jgi:hypothetical protein
MLHEQLVQLPSSLRVMAMQSTSLAKQAYPSTRGNGPSPVIDAPYPRTDNALFRPPSWDLICASEKSCARQAAEIEQ